MHNAWCWEMTTFENIRKFEVSLTLKNVQWICTKRLLLFSMIIYTESSDQARIVAKVYHRYTFGVKSVAFFFIVTNEIQDCTSQKATPSPIRSYTFIVYKHRLHFFVQFRNHADKISVTNLQTNRSFKTQYSRKPDMTNLYNFKQRHLQNEPF